MLLEMLKYTKESWKHWAEEVQNKESLVKVAELCILSQLKPMIWNLNATMIPWW